MEALTLLRKAEELGLKLSPDGESLSVKGRRTPEVLAFLPELKSHKHELLAYLEKRRQAEEKAAEIGRDLENDGLGIYWCDLFGEAVAFVWDERFRGLVPAGVVVYTEGEIEKLWGAEGPSDAQLRLIHEAKKRAGARIVDFTQGGTDEGGTS